MLEARVKLTWVPSVSSDVVSQVLSVAVDGDEVVYDLPPSANSFEVWVAEKASVEVMLYANDGTHSSDAARLGFVVPDLAAPLPPAELGFEIVETREV